MTYFPLHQTTCFFIPLVAPCKPLLQFRKKHSAIRNGSFTTVLADGRVYGFARENETEIIEIFVNDSDDTVEITVENARSILISKGNFYIVCRKNGEIIEEICS